MPRGEWFRKHNGPGHGRTKGAKNKNPSQIRDGILQSFFNRGGVKWLDSLEDDEFANLVSKILPRQVEQSGPDGGPQVLRIQSNVGFTKKNE